jgi:tyrosyl-tRNA synthetase
VSLNNARVTDEDAPILATDMLAGGVALVRKGRRNLAVVRAQ